MLNSRKFLFITLMIGLLTLPSIALAGTQIVEATLDGETAILQFDTPTSFGFAHCPQAFPTSAINLQGTVPDGWEIVGGVSIRAINGEIITLEEIQITSIDQFPLTIDYGPVEDYPLFQNPETDQFLREVHVDISIGFKKGDLYAEFVVISDSDSDIDGMSIPALGPYNDWDVFCFEEPPTDDHGCTPGYWKNHTDSWLPTGYSPGQTVESVFPAAAAFPTLASETLLVALDGGGGPGATGAAKILLRAATAAVLNASHPDVAYPRDEASAIADVNAALASGDRGTMLDLATALDDDNNIGCPLN